MKRRLWAPIVALGLAALILVPSTFAVHTPSPTLYAQLGQNRFPSGQGTADASLTFNGNRNVVLRIAITGPAGSVNAVRVYVDGTCSDPGIWVINRTTNAGPDGPFIQVASNSGVNTIQVNQLDVDRIAAELAGNPNETFALMVARVINGQNYRTCTQFRTTPFPPLTTTTSTTSSTPTTSATGTGTATNTTRFTTRTTVITTGGQTFTATITEPVTTSSLTTRLSTAFSTGTTVQTITTIGTGTTLTVNPTGTFTNTATNTSTGFSTGTSLSTGANTTVTSVFTTPVTTVLNTLTSTQTVGATTITFVNPTTITTTNVTTVPVTTVTLAL